MVKGELGRAGRIQQKGTGQMVPMARGAHFDDITSKVAFLGPLRKGLEFLGRGNTPTEGGEPGAKDIGHQDQGVVLADRAVLRRRLTDFARCSNQFRMGVAHLMLGQTTLFVFRDEVLTRESVIDLAALAPRGTAKRS